MNFTSRFLCLPASGCIGPWAAVNDRGWGRRVSRVFIPLVSSLQCGLEQAASLTPTGVTAPLKAAISS